MLGIVFVDSHTSEIIAADSGAHSCGIAAAADNCYRRHLWDKNPADLGVGPIVQEGPTHTDFSDVTAPTLGWSMSSA
jgi:hypothetical protein